MKKGAIKTPLFEANAENSVRYMRCFLQPDRCNIGQAAQEPIYILDIDIGRNITRQLNL